MNKHEADKIAAAIASDYDISHEGQFAISAALVAAGKAGERAANEAAFAEYQKYGGWTSLTARAEAWDAVVGTMEQLWPDWHGNGQTGIEAATATLRLAAATAALSSKESA